MVKIEFHGLEAVTNDSLKYAIIAAQQGEKWIVCRHKERTTWEMPGGHREVDEDIHDTARRELYEETGAMDFSIKPICIYSVAGDDALIHNESPTYGMLFYARVKTLTDLPADMEMAEIRFCEQLPENLTYPQIQPALWQKVKEQIKIVIREADIRDADAIYLLNKNGLGYDYPLEKTKERLAKIFSLQTDKIFVAQIGQQVVGYLHGSGYECSYTDSLKNILALVVDENHRRFGVGEKLITAVENWSKTDGSAGVRLVSGFNREKAHQFYLQCGYVDRKNQKNFIKLFK